MSIEKAKSIACDCFSSGYNCAESVLIGLVRALEMEDTSIPRIASGFGAGVGRNAEICGALSGAVMALGLKFGREDGKDNAAKEALYTKITELISAFRSKFNGVTCPEITGCDLSTQEGMERFKAENLHFELCPKFVAFATEYAGKQISE